MNYHSIMNIEKERKFLVKYLPEEVINKKKNVKLELTQVYLYIDDNIQLRLRYYKNFDINYSEYPYFSHATITFKKTINKTDRIEYEFSVDKTSASQIIDGKKYLCFLKKERYYHEGWEIDIYPNGLTVAEFEIKDYKPFPESIPDWIGEEITGVKEFSNIYIAQNFDKFS